MSIERKWLSVNPLPPFISASALPSVPCISRRSAGKSIAVLLLHNQRDVTLTVIFDCSLLQGNSSLLDGVGWGHALHRMVHSAIHLLLTCGALVGWGLWAYWWVTATRYGVGKLAMWLTGKLETFLNVWWWKWVGVGGGSLRLLLFQLPPTCSERRKKCNSCRRWVVCVLRLRECHLFCR